METRVHARLTAKEGRKFGLLVGGAFALIGGVSSWRGHTIAPVVLWVLGGTLMLGGAVIPTSLGPVYRAWMRFALVLSRVTTPIFMGVVYFVVLTPIGLVRRAFGRNNLVRPPGDGGTYWITRPAGSRRGDLDRQF